LHQLVHRVVVEVFSLKNEALAHNIQSSIVQIL
jgi:hypothetical protein